MSSYHDLPSSESSMLTELDPNFDPLPPSSPPTQISMAIPRTRRPRQTIQEKLQKHLDNLRQDSLSAADFLLLLQQSGRPEWHNCVQKLHTPRYRDAFCSLLDYDPVHVLEELHWGMPIYKEELTQLHTYGTAFGQWTDTGMKELDQHLALGSEDYLKEAEGLSPHLFCLVKQLLTQYSTKAEQKEIRAIELLSQICYSRAVKKSNNLPMQLGLHLHASGVQKRIINLLSQLGVCCNYRTVIDASKRISQISKDEVRALGSCSQSVTAYDNFEQTLGVKGQRIGENSEFYSVTTGEVLLGREIPAKGLSRDMLNPSVVLTYPQLIGAPGMKADTVEDKVFYRVLFYSFLAC